MQTPSNPCPRCGSSIPADAPGGICPACALLGVADFSPPEQNAGAKMPTLEEVAAAFPELEVLEIIGRGGMGIVFKARQPRLDRFVALKILPPVLAAQPGFAERFTREARALARLAHPHIVAVYDFGERAGFYHLVMEYVNGVNLRHAMRAGMTPEQALALVPRVCEALQFAHDRGVLHRDIKPENILLDTAGTPKVADFGIAKFADEPTAASGLTGTGAQLGTAAYMAPEQIERPSTVDHRADIYSLGVVLYEMLTGELPLGRFAAPSATAQVGQGVDDVVLRALEKERERRQQSATQMRTEVEHVSRRQPPRPGAVTPPPLPPDDEQADGLALRIFIALTSLSAVGIPVSAMLGWNAPTPIHMVALTIVFGTLTGLARTFAPEPSRGASNALTLRRTAREKDLGFAYLWWFLLGLCGAHKFYLGKIGWGFLYFFTGGLFFVGWIIDLFTLPDQVRRHNEAVRGLGPAEGRAKASAPPDPWARGILLLLVLIVGLPVAACILAILVTVLSRNISPKPAETAERAAFLATRPQAIVTAERPPFIGEVSEGSIELVAVSLHPAGDTRGWRMNGNPALEGPFVNRGATIGDDEKKQVYEFTFHTRGLPADAASFSWHVEGASGSAWGGAPELLAVPGRKLTDYAVIAAALPRDQRIADVRAGAAPGPWQTLTENCPGESIATSRDHAGLTWNITQGAAVEIKGGGIVATCSHSQHEGWQQRVVAVTADGKEMPASNAGQLNEQSEWRFEKIPLESIAQFRFQVRPIEWVLFRSVALAPSTPDLEK
ncbi:MAG: protein kinase [Chthoniobacteraceae bacterium]